MAGLEDAPRCLMAWPCACADLADLLCRGPPRALALLGKAVPRLWRLSPSKSLTRLFRNRRRRSHSLALCAQEDAGLPPRDAHGQGLWQSHPAVPIRGFLLRAGRLRCCFLLCTTEEKPRSGPKLGGFCSLAAIAVLLFMTQACEGQENSPPPQKKNPTKLMVFLPELGGSDSRHGVRFALLCPVSEIRRHLLCEWLRQGPPRDVQGKPEEEAVVPPGPGMSAACCVAGDEWQTRLDCAQTEIGFLRKRVGQLEERLELEQKAKKELDDKVGCRARRGGAEASLLSF